jgi:hypothetical protein
MDSFVQILRWLPIDDASSLTRDTSPFKVKINFDIPTFEILIDVNDIDKWLNLLEGNFFVHNFSNRENITFSLLKSIPHVKYWWETFCEQKEIEEPSLFTVVSLRKNTTLSKFMMIVYQMDHTASRKRPSNARVHKYLPYLVHQYGYQIFRETYGAQVSRCSRSIHL